MCFQYLLGKHCSINAIYQELERNFISEDESKGKKGLKRILNHLKMHYLGNGLRGKLYLKQFPYGIPNKCALKRFHFGKSFQLCFRIELFTPRIRRIGITCG